MDMLDPTDEDIDQIMNTEPVGKIYARMADAMSEIQAVGKTSRNQSQGFNFRGIDAVMNELHGILSKNRIFILQKLLEATHENKTTAKGTEMTHHFNRIEYQFTTDDGSHVDVTVVGESADSGDKGANKCMAVALKYALTQVFCIPTEDQGEPKDPDAQSHEFAATRERRNEEQKAKDDAQGVPTVPTSWRMHEVHFDFPKAKKKTKGVKLIDLDAVQLKWFQEKWQPRPWKGKMNAQDLALRAALDESMKAINEGVQDHPEEPKDEIPFEWGAWGEVCVYLEGEFNGKKLSTLTHEQRMSVFNEFKKAHWDAMDKDNMDFKKALTEWKADVEKHL